MKYIIGGVCMILGPVLFLFGIFHYSNLVEYNVFWDVVPESQKNEVYLLYGSAALSIIIAIVIMVGGSKIDKNKVMSNVDALIDDEKDDNSKDESDKVKPEKVAILILNRIGKGGDSSDINSKAIMNFYEDNFSIDAKKLKGKILSYKYDDVIAQTDKAGIMTLPPNMMWFYTSDGNDYGVEFDNVVDKVFLVGKCKNLK
jgi:hypothetical protein|tara:strand:- start:105 stop:704 length:600 start_codon:yes stop_codon:yes gene_type:complete